ncbi:MAG TPA: type II 3-dehydroquinate dehydratase [Acholeplasmataceae bacterium]|jgi:3-dehydroquinate dehydratase-2|nr:3-dehydroquinate dehydratase [Acholeplasmataceae bacterium]HPX71648.1 type II 3-dehydroquinate dehydratase [Acholeplasmataceae bacterium]
MKILVINGPNLNMLGKRDPKHYGKLTLEKLNDLIKTLYPDCQFEFYQSNHEGDLIDKIQTADKFDALLINPGGYTHTSVAIRDALEILGVPKVSVHLSNYLEREDFRKVDLVKDVVDKVFYGKKEVSYFEGIDYLISSINKN